MTSVLPGLEAGASITCCRRSPSSGDLADTAPGAAHATASRPASRTACCSRSWASATSARSTATTCPSCARYLRDLKDAEGPDAAARRHREGARRPAGQPGPGHLPHAAGLHARSARSGRTSRPRRAASKAYTDVDQRRDRRRDGSRPEGDGADRGDVPGEQAREGPRRSSRTGSSTSASASRTPSPSPPGRPRPACGRSSISTRTFLQRSFDQIFQEVALQNLPVVFTLDRAGLTGPDGPTHHGCFDIAYMRLFPNMVVMAPGDELDVAPMLDFALQQPHPTSMRYPKATLETVKREFAADRTGQGRSDRGRRRRGVRRLRHADAGGRCRRPTSSATRG